MKELIRKVRISNRSYIVALPTDIMKLLNLDLSCTVVYTIADDGTITIKKGPNKKDL